MGNVFIERLRRSLKYECADLRTFEMGSKLRAMFRTGIGYYDASRHHSGLGELTRLAA
jgi:putative transposase